MEKTRIRDKHPESATLLTMFSSRPDTPDTVAVHLQSLYVGGGGEGRLYAMP
jgi:hypothetical protein